MGQDAPRVAAPEDLWAVDPDEFVEQRDALVRRLRGEGDREGASAVAAMRKPPRSAWALNVVARDDPAVVEAALQTAEAVARAMADGGDDLRAAMSASREATESLVDAASARPGAASEEWRSRIRATVQAATSDPSVADQLRSGVLRADHEPTGFAGLTLGETAAVPRAAAKKSPSRRRPAAVERKRQSGRKPAKAEPADEAERARERERELDARREREAAERARELELQRSTVERLEREVAELDDAAERAAEAAKAAAEAAKAARAELDEAREELARLAAQSA